MIDIDKIDHFDILLYDLKNQSKPIATRTANTLEDAIAWQKALLISEDNITFQMCKNLLSQKI